MSVIPPLPKTEFVNLERFTSIAEKGVDHLYVVATNDDFFAYLSKLQPFDADGSVLYGTVGRFTYHVGLIDGKVCVLVKTSSDHINSVGGAQDVNFDATRFWKPRDTKTILKSGELWTLAES